MRVSHQAVAKYQIFGRVTPDQKLKFVEALKAQGRTVAMTGDGVNDVLALKDAGLQYRNGIGKRGCIAGGTACSFGQ